MNMKNLLTNTTQFLLLLSLTSSIYSQVPPDDDNDGISNDADNYPSVAAQYKEIQMPDYKIIYSDESKIINLVSPDYVTSFSINPGTAEKRTRDSNLAKLIYKHFDDTFDFLMLTTTQPGIYNSHSEVKPHASGTGTNWGVDNSSLYGSKGELNSFVTFGDIKHIRYGPGTHEVMHAWAHARKWNSLPWFHAGYSNFGGILGGWIPNTLKSLSDGNYQIETTPSRCGTCNSVAPNGWAVPLTPYGNFELYLAGLIGPDEVGHDLKLAIDFIWVDRSKGIFSASSIETTTIYEYISEYGERIPNHLESRKHFEALYVVISDEPLTLGQWSEADSNVHWFQMPKSDGDDSRYNFWESTKGKATMSFNQTDQILTPGTNYQHANVAPSVTISGGDRTVADTDGIAGESVSFTGTATDSDGTIATTEWLVDGSEVATGLSATISLPNRSTVVTFKATDNDGVSSTTTATITVATPTYTVTDEWPSPYNGVTPDSSLGLAFNNIGIYDSAGSTIYTCLRIFTDGLPGSASGISEFDIGLTVVSLDEATVQITKYREFNTIGALNENVELPDCSGKFETTTSVYTDIIEVGDSVLDTTWSLIDPTNLILKLSSYQELTAN
jgi:hypothetical protein